MERGPTRRAVLAAAAATLPLGTAGQAEGAAGTTREMAKPPRQEASGGTDPGDAWPSFGYNQRNTGHNPHTTGPTEGVAVDRTFQTSSRVETAAVVADGRLYVGTRDGTLAAFSTSDGTPDWTASTTGAIEAAPTVHDGSVYVGSQDRHIYSLSAADGSVEWRVRADDWVYTSPAVVDGVVYVGSRGGTFYALAAADGTEQWTAQAGGPIFASPAVADGTVYFGSNDRTVYALATVDGSEEWTLDTQRRVSAAPTVVDGTVYVASQHGNVYALSAADGSQIWRARKGDFVQSSPTVANGSVYVTYAHGYVFALAAADGQERWSQYVGFNVESTPAVAGDAVFVAGDERVYGLSAADGSIHWQVAKGYTAQTSPSVVDETVYLPIPYNRILAFREPTTFERTVEATAGKTVSIDCPDQVGEHVTFEEIRLTPAVDEELSVSVTVGTEPLRSTPTYEFGKRHRTPEYLSIDHSLAESDVESATLRFSVTKDALKTFNSGRDSMALYRHQDGEWVAMPTTVVDDTDDSYRYETTASGLSEWAVTAHRPSIDVGHAQDEFATADLSDSVYVTTELWNTGELRAEFLTTLRRDGEVVDRRRTTVEAGDVQGVSFRPSRDEPGEYTVSHRDVVLGSLTVGAEGDGTPTATPGGQGNGGGTPTATPGTGGDDGTPATLIGLGLGGLGLLGAGAWYYRTRYGGGAESPPPIDWDVEGSDTDGDNSD